MSQLKRSILLLCLACGASLAQGLDHLPVQPVHPTRGDCRKLDRQFFELVRELSRQEGNCMNEEPIFGTVKGCSGRPEYVAWKQCQPLALQKCEMERQQETAVHTCEQEARQNDPDEDSQNQEKAAADMNVMNDLFEQGDKLRKALNSPESFLSDALSPQDMLFKALHPGGPNASPRFDAVLGQEIYRYIEGMIQHGTASTTNPLIRSVQATSLKMIVETFAEKLRDSEHAFAQTDQLAASNNDTFTVKRLPLSSKPSGLESEDCEIIRDPGRSRALKERDVQHWLQLTATCNPR